MKIFFRIAILLFSSYLYSQDDKTFDLVIAKLKDDKKAYEQFVNLGKIYCEDVSKKTDLFTDQYVKLFNSLNVFPRLIERNALEKEYKIFKKRLKKDKCSCLYSLKNEKLKVRYIKLVQDKTSYHDNKEYYLEEDMQDYLKDGKVDASRFQ
ncbi:hypothetical protein B4N84_11390 [Flavobacterium sp. IR1]|nr:hypothetical protein B4N84_11390 [Flavobacterium sp. IR1]